MRHPLKNNPRSWRLVVLVVLIALTFIVGRQTKQDLYVFPMNALELAPNTKAAWIIIALWKAIDPGLHAAHSLQYWDNYFILCYSTSLALACLIIADWLYSSEARANFHGKLLAGLMLVAGILDYVENYAINKMLDGSVETRWVNMSSWSASIKFALIGTGLIYIISGVVVGLMRRKKAAADLR